MYTWHSLASLGPDGCLITYPLYPTSAVSIVSPCDSDARLVFIRCAGTSSCFRVGIGQAAARRNVAQSLSTSLERRATVGCCLTAPFAWKPGSGGALRPCVAWFHLPRGQWGPSPFLDCVAVHPLIMPFVIFELPFSCRSHVFVFSLALKDVFRRLRRV
jgi:hypothetical protein